MSSKEKVFYLITVKVKEIQAGSSLIMEMLLSTFLPLRNASSTSLTGCGTWLNPS